MASGSSQPFGSFRAERFVGLRYLLRPRRSKLILSATIAWGLLMVETIVNFVLLNDAVRTALQSISVAEMVVPRFPTSSTSRLQGGGNGAMTPSPSSVGAPEPR